MSDINKVIPHLKKFEFFALGQSEAAKEVQEALIDKPLEDAIDFIETLIDATVASIQKLIADGRGDSATHSKFEGRIQGLQVSSLAIAQEVHDGDYNGDDIAIHSSITSIIA